MRFKNWYFVKWIRKYESNKILYKFLYSFVLILFISTLWINFLILPFVYYGIRLSRNDSYKRFKNWLIKVSFNHKIIYYFYIFILICVILVLIIMLVPIPFMVFIIIGYYFEYRKSIIKINQNPYNVENINIRKDKNILTKANLS